MPAEPAASTSNMPRSGISLHSNGFQRGTPSGYWSDSRNSTRCQGGFRLTTSGTRMSASRLSSIATSSRIRQSGSQTWSSPITQTHSSWSRNPLIEVFRFSTTDAEAVTDRCVSAGCLVAARLTVKSVKRPISPVGSAIVPGLSDSNRCPHRPPDLDLGHVGLVVDPLHLGLLAVDEGVAAVEHVAGLVRVDGPFLVAAVLVLAGPEPAGSRPRCGPAAGAGG